MARPAPNTPWSVITKSSPNSVPTTTRVSRPSPPSMRTGALTVCEMKSAPWPPLMVVNGASGSSGVAGAEAGPREGAAAPRPPRRLEEVEVGEAVVRVRAVARRGEDLADLEGVVPGVAEDRRRGQRVVQDEDVGALAAVDRERAVDVAVVVDALEEG